jgi:primosomal protein N' (replication factor Y) (superfamily II helicase)
MQVGARVRVRLHHRPVGGWVTVVDPEPPADVALQPITGYSGLGPPLAVVELASWAAWRWAVPVATLLRGASPPRNIWELPVGPGPGAARLAGDGGPGPSPSGSGAESAGHLAPGTELVRLGPATDPLPLVLDLIEGVGGAGSVVVLVPSVGWAERLRARLRHRGIAVAADWAEAAAGWPVVVGSRATAWAPVPALAGAVVLDAHDEAYRHRYDAAEVVAARAAREGVPCRLVSACPTAVQLAHHRLVVAPDERSGWPALSVVDRRAADPRTGLLSEELVRLADRLASRLAAAPLVCVLNRTGRARLLACAACGELARCATCGRPVDQVDDGLRCRGCGTARPVVCAACGRTRLKVLRPGVSRIREELAALLGVDVGEVTADTADTAGDAGDAGDAGGDRGVPATPVLVGTEAVLHRVRRAAAVVFLDFDQHLLAPRFTAAEESLALLARAGRLVGGRGTAGAGPVVVQTRLPDHPVLAAAVAGDPGQVDERPLREELGLPPFAALAVVGGEAAAAYCAALAGGASDGAADGPLPPPAGLPMPTVGLTIADLGDGRWLVRARNHRTLCDALAATPRPAGRLRVTVDPTDQ